MFLRAVTGRRTQEARGKTQDAGGKFRWVRLPLAACLLAATVSLACSASVPTPTPTLVPSPTARRASAPSPTAEPDDTGWQSLGNRVEWRRLKVELNGVNSRLWLARLDPARVQFRVLYDRANPRLVNFSPNVQPTTGTGGTIRFTKTADGGSCTLICHGYSHNDKDY